MAYNEFLMNGYFLICGSTGHGIDYHSIEYCTSEDALKEYIEREFKGTTHSAVCDLSIEQMMEGASYDAEDGSYNQVNRVKLIHGKDLQYLFRTVDFLDTYDEDGERVYLSDYLKDAESESEIEEIIEIYNDGQDNYW